MLELIGFILFAIGCDALLKKFDIYGALLRWVSNNKVPYLLQKAVNCDFCLRVWLLVPLTLLFLFIPKSIFPVFYPIIGSAVLLVIDKHRQD